MILRIAFMHIWCSEKYFSSNVAQILKNIKLSDYYLHIVPEKYIIKISF